MENIFTLLSNYIFPIAACIMLYKELQEIRKDHAAALETEREAHKEEMESMRVVLENNTIALVEIREALKRMEGVRNG